MRIFKFIFLFAVFSLFAFCSKKSEDVKSEEKVYLTLSKESFKINEDDQTLNVLISSNASVSVEANKDWCQPELVENEDGYGLNIHVSANDTDKNRTVEILVVADNSLQKNITISQSGKATEGDTNFEPGIELTVGSYNIRVVTQGDVETGNGWEVSRKEPLINLISSFNPDVLGVQEGMTNGSLVDIHSALPQYNMIRDHYGAISNPTVESLAIYYKSSLFQELENGVFYLSETPEVENSVGWDATDIRICQWVKLKDKKEGEIFYVFNTHFYYQFETAILNSAHLVVQKIKEITGNYPVIFTGDFNMRTSYEANLVILQYLLDAYDLTETPPKGPTGTAFPGGVFEGTPQKEKRLDHIFVKEGTRVLTYEASDFTYNNGRHPSDHLPIFSQLILPKN